MWVAKVFSKGQILNMSLSFLNKENVWKWKEKSASPVVNEEEGGCSYGSRLTVGQSGLFHRVAEGSDRVHSIGLNRQLVASERLQRPEEDLLSGAATHKHGCPECTVTTRELRL